MALVLITAKRKATSFIGHTSPECIPAVRQADTLTTPPSSPPTMLPEQEEEALNQCSEDQWRFKSKMI